MQIRMADPGDLEGIASVLRESFNVYRCIGIDGEYLEKIFRVDDSVATNSIFVVEEDGRIVSVTMVVEREIKTAIGWLPFAGIANVATHPKYRGRGLASKLLAFIEKQYEEKQYPMIGLLAGYGEPAHRLYRRRGFYDIAYYRERIFVLDDIPKLVSQLRKRAYGEKLDGSVLPITEAGAEQLCKLYNSWIVAKYYGVFKRSLRRWRGILETNQYATWFLGDHAEGWYYEMKSGKAYSLVFMIKNSPLSGCRDCSAAYILEIVAEPRLYPLVLADTMKKLFDSDTKTIYYRPPPDKEYMVEKTRLIIPDETFMVKPCCMECLIKLLQNHFKEATIAVDSQANVVLEYSSGTIEFTPDSLLRIILGVSAPFEEYFDGKIRVRGNYRILLEEFSADLIFRPHYIPLIDKW